MKISLFGRAYPFFLQSAVGSQLRQYFTMKEAQTFLTKTGKTYKEIIQRAADIGGRKNFFIDNIYLGAYIIALYKNINGKMSLAQLDVLIVNSLDQLKLLKRKMKKQNFISEQYKDKLRKASLWCKANEKKYPANWQVDLIDTGQDNELCFQISKCGLCYLCKSEGVSELIPLLCRTDYITIGYAGCRLERNETLSSGDDRCLFLVTKI